MDTLTKYDFKGKVSEAIANAKRDYLDDLKAMSEETLINCPGGCARTPADFTYEIVIINRRIVKRLKGEDPGPLSVEGWMTAPDEFRSKGTMMAEFDATTSEIENVLAAIPQDEMLRTIQLPKETTTPYDLVRFAAYHIGYHDAQLNYLQTLNSDGEMHWQYD